MKLKLNVSKIFYILIAISMLLCMLSNILIKKTGNITTSEYKILIILLLSLATITIIVSIIMYIIYVIKA